MIYFSRRVMSLGDPCQKLGSQGCGLHGPSPNDIHDVKDCQSSNILGFAPSSTCHVQFDGRVQAALLRGGALALNSEMRHCPRVRIAMPWRVGKTRRSSGRVAWRARSKPSQRTAGALEDPTHSRSHLCVTLVGRPDAWPL